VSKSPAAIAAAVERRGTADAEIVKPIDRIRMDVSPICLKGIIHCAHTGIPDVGSKN
jgi:hypothetical protein